MIRKRYNNFKINFLYVKNNIKYLRLHNVGLSDLYDISSDNLMMDAGDFDDRVPRFGTSILQLFAELRLGVMGGAGDLGGGSGCPVWDEQGVV